MDIVNVLLMGIGGLGLFFYGFHITGKALQRNASFKFKKLLDKLTSNVFMSTILGFLVTIVVQSSSATTVLLVNFINSGLISLVNSFGIIFGANIGTTITVQIISFHIDQYVMPAIGLGVVLKLFSQRDSLKNIGDIILGFGIIFLGLIVMKDAASPLQNSGFFNDFLASVTTGGFNGVILGLVVSATIASIIQSSAATLAIVIALSSTGIISDISTAIPLILGAKIGTCITSFLASVEANRDAKRAATAHFIFNIVETVLVLSLFPYFVELIKMTSSNITRQIANAHSISALATAAICIPLTKPMAKILQLMIPKKEEEKNSYNLFDPKLLETPSIALNSVKQALLRMGGMIAKMLKTSCDGFIKNDFREFKTVYKLEKEVDLLQSNISSYIMEISKIELPGYQALILNSYRESTNDFERIADHIENIADSVTYAKLQKKNLDSYSMESINRIKARLLNHYQEVYNAFSETNTELAEKLLANKTEDKEMYRSYTININQKIIKGDISPENGMLLVDVIYNLQRISYHMRRILYSVLRISQKYEHEEEQLVDADDI
jgi:phosphate:Na+ symporter